MCMAHNGDQWSIGGERSQAYLENGYTKVDAPISIHQGGALRAAQGDMMDRPAHPQRSGAGGAKVVSSFAKL
jgi:hypothetical protein